MKSCTRSRIMACGTTKVDDINFDPKAYLNTFFRGKEFKSFQMVASYFHEFWKSIDEVKPKLLEFGGGPSLHCLMSACPHVRHITFAEYLKVNRIAVQAWHENRNDGFDWSSAFEYVVQELEGKGKEDAIMREEELRHKMGAIVPCDIHKDPIVQFPKHLPVHFTPPFDIVTTAFCLEVAVENVAQFEKAMHDLTRLIKPGGYLLVFGDLNKTFYMLEGVRFDVFPITKEMVLEAMSKAGLESIDLKLIEGYASDGGTYNCTGSFFATGRVKC